MTSKELEHLIELRKGIESVDGDCFFPGEIETEIDSFKEKKIKAAEREAERIKKRNKSYYMFIDAADYMDNQMLLTDSIIDACCTQGCVVEPDGYCEHNNPSVLIANEMI